MNLKKLKDSPPWDWPEDTPAVLHATLVDGRAKESDRLLAAHLAGDYTVMNDELAGTLLDIVRRGDEKEELRGAAVISLGPALEDADTMGFEDSDETLISEETFLRIRQSLRELFLDTSVPRELRRRILEASVRAPEEWHGEAVRTAYGEKDRDWRLTAVFCMCFISGFSDQILEVLDSDDPNIRYHAVVAAGNWGVKAAWPEVVNLCTDADTDKQLKLAAIDAIACIRPQEALEILSELTEDEDEDIVAAAYDALAIAEGQLESTSGSRS